MQHVHEIVASTFQAAEAIMDVYAKTSPDIAIKEDLSPVTEADIASNKIICASLLKYFPNIPILSEENKNEPFEKRQHWNTFWLVDPLDGTKEFMKKNGEFTINIGLIEKGTPVFGLIYAPVLRQLYVAFQNQAFKGTDLSNLAPIKVSGRTHNLISVGSKSHASPEDSNFLSQFSISDSKQIGSSLKFCLVAEGKADIYYRSGPTMEWDTAAGHALVLAAGGRVEGITYKKPDLKNSAFCCYGY